MLCKLHCVMDFAKNLKIIRKSLKVSQQQLADKMGLAQSTVGMWEAGHRTPKLDEMKRLAIALNTTINNLICEDNEPMNKENRLDISKNELYVDGLKVEELDTADIHAIIKLIKELKSSKAPLSPPIKSSNKKSGKKILIIDDEHEMCDALYSFLVPHNYKVFLSFNGQMGLEYFGEIKPDVVLLDLTMPDMNGIDVLRIIRKVSTVPVIVLTGNPENVVDIHLSGLDITGYIEKPFSLEQIINLLKHLLGE
jgi:CheY-like chemotaxis protein/DNA-binding XRE family transcriptional regulator